MDDIERAWARFRDECEAAVHRAHALMETARAALSASDVPLEAVRETLSAAELEISHIDALFSDHATRVREARALLVQLMTITTARN